VLFVATVHGVCLSAIALVVRWVGREVMGWCRELSSTDSCDRFWVYALPVQTHAQSTVLVYAAVAPLFMHWSMPETPETEPGTEPVSAHAHIQTCFFQVLILTTALFLDALFFAVIWTPYFLL
jgi:hypothetical protein